MGAYRLDMRARRNDTWAPAIEIEYAGGEMPLTGATIRMEIRQYPGQQGDPNLSIANVSFTDELLSGTPDGPDEKRLLTLRPVLGWGQLSALPGLNQPEAGDAQTFYHDAVIIYPGGDGLREAILEGRLIVAPGVTRPF